MALATLPSLLVWAAIAGGLAHLFWTDPAQARLRARAQRWRRH